MAQSTFGKLSLLFLENGWFGLKSENMIKTTVGNQTELPGLEGDSKAPSSFWLWKCLLSVEIVQNFGRGQEQKN